MKTKKMFFLSLILLGLFIPSINLRAEDNRITVCKTEMKGGKWKKDPNTGKFYIGYKEVITKKMSGECVSVSCTGRGVQPCIPNFVGHTITMGASNSPATFDMNLFTATFEALFSRIQDEFLWNNSLPVGELKSPSMHLYTIDGEPTYVVVHAKWTYDADTESGEVDFTVFDLGPKL